MGSSWRLMQLEVEGHESSLRAGAIFSICNCFPLKTMTFDDLFHLAYIYKGYFRKWLGQLLFSKKIWTKPLQEPVGIS